MRVMTRLFSINFVVSVVSPTNLIVSAKSPLQIWRDLLKKHKGTFNQLISGKNKVYLNTPRPSLLSRYCNFRVSLSLPGRKGTFDGIFDHATSHAPLMSCSDVW